MISVEFVLIVLLLLSVTRTSFESLLIIVLLMVATCTYVHERFPPLLDRSKEGCVFFLRRPPVRPPSPLPRPTRPLLTTWLPASPACSGRRPASASE